MKPWIIEEIEREKEISKQHQERPRLYAPMYDDRFVEEKKENKEEEKRGVIVIDIGGNEDDD